MSERYHPDMDVQQWSVQSDHIHVMLVIPSQNAVLVIVGSMKANLSRQLRLRYSQLKWAYWEADHVYDKRVWFDRAIQLGFEEE